MGEAYHRKPPMYVGMQVLRHQSKKLPVI